MNSGTAVNDDVSNVIVDVMAKIVVKMIYAMMVDEPVFEVVKFLSFEEGWWGRLCGVTSGYQIR
jgi:Mn-containing catalase